MKTTMKWMIRLFWCHTCRNRPALLNRRILRENSVDESAFLANYSEESGNSKENCFRVFTRF